MPATHTCMYMLSTQRTGMGISIHIQPNFHDYELYLISGNYCLHSFNNYLTPSNTCQLLLLLAIFSFMFAP